MLLYLVPAIDGFNCILCVFSDDSHLPIILDRPRNLIVEEKIHHEAQSASPANRRAKIILETAGLRPETDASISVPHPIKRRAEGGISIARTLVRVGLKT